MTEQGKPTPETNSPPPGNNAAGGENTPPSDIEGLRTRLQAAEKARDEYLPLVKQTRAEFENYQKRNARDMAAERRFAQTPLASDLLPALDNLERAIAAAGQFENKGSLAQ